MNSVLQLDGNKKAPDFVFDNCTPIQFSLVFCTKVQEKLSGCKLSKISSANAKADAVSILHFN